MRYLISIIIGLIIAVPAWAELPCYQKAVPFISIPHDKPGTITLEARRVKAVDKNVIQYDLGREIITIEAESFAARRFLRDVASGRCAAREKVTLEPLRNSPFNTKFKAVTFKRAH